MPQLAYAASVTLAFIGGTRAATATRFIAYNIEDLRAAEIANPSNKQANAAIAVIGALQPDVLLINELHYDGPMDANGCVREGTAAHAFAERIATAYPALQYQVVVAPVNTGVPSGRDIDGNGAIVTAEGTRGYGNDCLGFGNFPGQYGMALFVRQGITVEWEKVRTFRTFKWNDMPDNLLPALDAELTFLCRDSRAMFPLSSKSHWDVPIVLESGARVHVLASHPTPPVFDGPEDRNGRRNHDEIRLWVEYLDDAAWITDDACVAGGLDADEAFVIMGDLNADPESGDAAEGAIDQLLTHPRVQGGVAPRAKTSLDDERGDVTSSFGLRVDYVLPSRGAKIVAQGVYWRAGDGPEDAAATVSEDVVGAASDHHPVWVEVVFPTHEQREESRPE